MITASGWPTLQLCDGAGTWLRSTPASRSMTAHTAAVSDISIPWATAAAWMLEANENKGVGQSMLCAY
jgi:hypothetical protein